MNGVGNALTENGQQQICLNSAQVTDGYWFRADRWNCQEKCSLKTHKF